MALIDYFKSKEFFLKDIELFLEKKAQKQKEKKDDDKDDFISQCVFRLAKPDDAVQIAAVELLSARYEKRLYPLNVPYDVFITTWQDRLKTRKFTVIIAEYKGRITGFLALKGRIKDGFIGALYIMPNYFRRGIGRNLIHLCEEVVLRKKGKALTLHVEPLNDGAISFYESLSFLPQAVKSSHLIVYKKELYHA